MSINGTIFRYESVLQTVIAPLKAKGMISQRMLCYFIGAKSQLVEHEINDLVIAIDFATVSTVPNLVLAVGKNLKTPMIHTALAVVRTMYPSPTSTVHRLRSNRTIVIIVWY